MCTVFRFVTFDLTDAAGDADDENQFFDQEWQATPTCEGQYLYENTTVVNQLDQNGNLVEVEEEGWRNSLADYINKDTLIFNDLDRTCIALLPVLESSQYLDTRTLEKAPALRCFEEISPIQFSSRTRSRQSHTDMERQDAIQPATLRPLRLTTMTACLT